MNCKGKITAYHNAISLSRQNHALYDLATGKETSILGLHTTVTLQGIIP